MAAECENFCPRINALEMLASTTNFFSAFDGGFSLDSRKMDSLGMAIMASGNCQGPLTEIRTVRIGIIHRSTVQEEVFVCGLEQRHISKTVTTQP